MEAQDFKSQREQMVKRQLQARDIDDPRILKAMRDIPRHRFVPASQISQAYDDHPLTIGEGQTISQPYIVALMTQLVRPGKSSKTLEVGTGSGYQAAVLAGLVDEVYTIRSLLEGRLARCAAERMTSGDITLLRSAAAAFAEAVNAANIVEKA